VMSVWNHFLFPKLFIVMDNKQTDPEHRPRVPSPLETVAVPTWGCARIEILRHVSVRNGSPSFPKRATRLSRYRGNRSTSRRHGEQFTKSTSLVDRRYNAVIFTRFYCIIHCMVLDLCTQNMPKYAVITCSKLLKTKVPDPSRPFMRPSL
jgi:hypothetical protein